MAENAGDTRLSESMPAGGGDIFRFTEHVYLELSNLCNYADSHKACPVNKLQEGRTILPCRIVADVLETLGRHYFSGRIGFHTYNEPLMDPRLLDFVKKARSLCPESEIYICTNGYYLNQDLAVELVQAGVSSFHVSVYSEPEEDRLKKIKVLVDYSVRRMRLDERLNLYNLEASGCNKPCYCPLYQIIVTAGGRISLCCLDWQRRHCFGNLNEQSFEEAMKNEQMWLTYERLSRGERFLDLCKRCRTARGAAPAKKDVKEQDCERAISRRRTIDVPEPVAITSASGKSILINVADDLADFTALSIQEVRRLLKRIGYSARDEYVECIERESSDHWFYLGSRYFIFENAIHSAELVAAVRELLPPGAKVWEFGGGTGNLSLALAAEGHEVSFTELNSLQKDFVRFRAERHNLKLRSIDSWQPKPTGYFDLVIALEVLEHIPDYYTALLELCQAVKPGGILWESTSFRKDHNNPTHRIADRHDYKKILADQGFSRVLGAQTGKLWQKQGDSRALRQKRNDSIASAPINFENIESGLAGEEAVSFKTSIRRAWEELQSGNCALALDYLEDAYWLRAGSAECECYKLLLALQRNQVSRLEAEAQIAADKEPQMKVAALIVSYIRAGALLRQGIDKLAAGQPTDALVCFDDVKVRGFPNVQFARATALVRMGRLCSARQACLAELQIQPGHEGTSKLLERIEKAISEFSATRQQVCRK
jgi:2-polyprenyl-3-methyl-5-hydroxy-6-metoxy-1,4-benzoquinol methylase